MRNLKLETRNSRPCPVSSFQIRISSFHGPRLTAPRTGGMRVFAEAMGKGTWRSRGRAHQGRPGASRAYPAAPFRAEDTPPCGTASNLYAVTIWIIYQEIKGDMHCDLTESDLDDGLCAARSLLSRITLSPPARRPETDRAWPSRSGCLRKSGP